MPCRTPAWLWPAAIHFSLRSCSNCLQSCRLREKLSPKRVWLAGVHRFRKGTSQREGLGAGYGRRTGLGRAQWRAARGPTRADPARFTIASTPAGRIVLRDFVLDDDRAGPPEAAIFALQIAVGDRIWWFGYAQRLGPTGWLYPALRRRQALALPDGNGGQLIMAHKTSLKQLLCIWNFETGFKARNAAIIHACRNEK